MSDEYMPTTEAIRAKYARGSRSDGTPAQFVKWQKEFDRWLAARDAKVAQRARAEGWEAARAEVRMIPCWFNTVTGNGGFDLQNGEVASEEGAWMEVTRVLSKNPYQEQEEEQS